MMLNIKNMNYKNMNTYQKYINEQFSISDLDFTDDGTEYNTNIFNKDVLDIDKIAADILYGNDIDEGVINKLNNYTSVFKVKSKQQLQNIVVWYSNNYPNDSLNWLDVSGITDMSYLFYNHNYNGDISEWDVSNVTNMKQMFMFSVFNQDISKWDVSNVTNMKQMFTYSKFNKDISNWDVANVEHFYEIFAHSILDIKYRPDELEGIYNYIYC